MFVNFVAFIICVCAAIYLAHEKYRGCCAFAIVCALCNMPFAVEWLIKWVRSLI